MIKRTYIKEGADTSMNMRDYAQRSKDYSEHGREVKRNMSARPSREGIVGDELKDMEVESVEMEAQSKTVDERLAKIKQEHSGAIKEVADKVEKYLEKYSDFEDFGISVAIMEELIDRFQYFIKGWKEEEQDMITNNPELVKKDPNY
jgi:hypothetical protein